MSIMEQIMKSAFCCFLFTLLGIVGIPLLVLVPLAIGILMWEAFGLIENPLIKDFIYCTIFMICVVTFVIKTTYINFFRKHLWRLPELPKDK